APMAMAASIAFPPACNTFSPSRVATSWGLVTSPFEECASKSLMLECLGHAAESLADEDGAGATLLSTGKDADEICFSNLGSRLSFLYSELFRYHRRPG